MKKKSITYSDLSKKQLQYLKEFYIQKKVEGMSYEELKEFVFEIINHQINDTIGKEEEMEAWREMSSFFEDQFENIVLEIQKKYGDNEEIKLVDENTQQHRLKLLEQNFTETDKKDMWDD
tara:strand:+ start:466 stop:825 length:360 start_codon:yes stop_codon:yes gene_type:complete